jgi:hypothetical protein
LDDMTASKEPIMPILPFGGDAAFDSETTRLLGAAFEAAWKKAKASDGLAADEPRAALAREILAKGIIETAKRGERTHDRLIAGALAHLAKSTVGVATAKRAANGG